MPPAASSAPTREPPARDGQQAVAPVRVGCWCLIERVADGPLAETYRARPDAAPSDRPAAYALKRLKRRWHDDPGAIRLFCREALVGRLARHPHLISILSANVGEPPYYVVMPWLSGATLARRLAEGWRPDLPVALWIARQTAEALGALDAADWMHGDVKPENVFVSPEGHVTLLDLGSARRPSEETGSAADRFVLGSGAYLAPETVTSALRADIRSDLYSLGVMLFEMLAGRLPFEAGSLGEMVRLHLQARPPDLRRLAPHLPSGVVRLVRELLAKEPLRRPASPREVVRRLVALEVRTFAERATVAGAQGRASFSRGAG